LNVHSKKPFDTIFKKKSLRVSGGYAFEETLRQAQGNFMETVTCSSGDPSILFFSTRCVFKKSLRMNGLEFNK